MLGYGIGHYVILPLLPKDFQDGTALYKLWLALQEAAKPIERLIPFLFPADPNDLVGPAGFGTQGFVTAAADAAVHHRVRERPQEGQRRRPGRDRHRAARPEPRLVHVPARLDPVRRDHDFRPGRPHSRITTSVDTTNVDGTPLHVNVSASLNQQTGLVTWTFLSLDPATGLAPTDLVAGFLPADDSTGRGEAFVNYTVRPKASDSTGTTVNAQATVVFDTNAPLNTNTSVNTIDAGHADQQRHRAARDRQPPPASPSAGPASDDAGGSGIASYNVYRLRQRRPVHAVPDRHHRDLGHLHRPGRPHLRLLQRRHRQRRQRPADSNRRAGHDQARPSRHHPTNQQRERCCRARSVAPHSRSPGLAPTIPAVRGSPATMSMFRPTAKHSSPS